jgi:hypothetical protein
MKTFNNNIKELEILKNKNVIRIGYIVSILIILFGVMGIIIESCMNNNLSFPIFKHLYVDLCIITIGFVLMSIILIIHIKGKKKENSRYRPILIIISFISIVLSALLLILILSIGLAILWINNN